VSGFFGVLYYWLVRTGTWCRELDSLRVYLLGGGTDGPGLKAEINRFLIAESTDRWTSFASVSNGRASPDLDTEMVVSILDWVVERFRTLCSSRADQDCFAPGDPAEKRLGSRNLDVLREPSVRKRSDELGATGRQTVMSNSVRDILRTYDANAR
jgi:hypothetical protein